MPGHREGGGEQKRVDRDRAETEARVKRVREMLGSLVRL